MHTLTYTRTYVRTHAHTHTRARTHAHTHTHTHAHTHAHTHTHAVWWHFHTKTWTMSRVLTVSYIIYSVCSEHTSSMSILVDWQVLSASAPPAISPGHVLTVVAPTTGGVEYELVWAVKVVRVAVDTTIELGAVAPLLVVAVSPPRTKLVVTALRVKTTDQQSGRFMEGNTGRCRRICWRVEKGWKKTQEGADGHVDG